MLGLGEDDVASANKVIKGTKAVTWRAPRGPGAPWCHLSHSQDVIVRYSHEATDKFLALVLFVSSFLFIFVKMLEPGSYAVTFGDLELGRPLSAVSFRIQTPAVRKEQSRTFFLPFLKEMGVSNPVSRLLGCSVLPSTVQKDPEFSCLLTKGSQGLENHL